MRLSKSRRNRSRKLLRHVKSNPFALPRCRVSESGGNFPNEPWISGKLLSTIVAHSSCTFSGKKSGKTHPSRWWNFHHKFSAWFWKIYWALWRMNARRECQSPLLGRREAKKNWFVETWTWIEWISWMYAFAIEFLTMIFPADARAASEVTLMAFHAASAKVSRTRDKILIVFSL